MTGAEWLECGDCRRLWEVVKSKKSLRATNRTIRLCLAAFWGWQALRFPAKETKNLLASVVAAEKWAETGTRPNLDKRFITLCTYLNAKGAVTSTVNAVHNWEDDEAIDLQASLLRDIFGNPFRPVTLDPSWLTSTVLALATGIYADPAFDRMPILADALQDAGCDNEDILNHCRQPGEHVKGCWCVDLILNKK
jgi:hypothetical protein